MRLRHTALLLLILILFFVRFSPHRVDELPEHKISFFLIEEQIVEVSTEYSELVSFRESSSMLASRGAFERTGLKPIEVELSKEEQEFLLEISIEHQVPFEVMMAKIFYESRFQADAVGYNRNGSVDRGLSQINSSNHNWCVELLGREPDYFNSYDSMLLGVLIYAHYQEYWLERGLEGVNLIHHTLNSYNMGIRGFLNAGAPSTRKYSENIVNLSKDYLEEMKGENYEHFIGSVRDFEEWWNH